MDMETTAGACPAAPPPWRARIICLLRTSVVPTLLLTLLLLAWQVRQHPPYSSGSDFGYWLGVAGGSLMLALLIYPLRKRLRFLWVLGPLRHWFRFHLVAGIVGPTLILFHSTFRIGSFNAAIALASMLLVVASGLVGRFLYRKIHKGLYGSRATAAELQEDLARRIEALQPLLASLPAIANEIAGFAALVAEQPVGGPAVLRRFWTLHRQHRRARRRIGRTLSGHDLKPSGTPVDKSSLEAVAVALEKTLQAAHRTALFTSYERLFSLWHVIHIPFLCMLFVTAVVHVVAVHAY
ncbi:MAG: hypothetical protein RBS28_03715 [Rhodocyclaceae bacterium]|jgi:hypothetical protein|nr:hypothetical protein [Rhodocyclaceae bacterium]